MRDAIETGHSATAVDKRSNGDHSATMLLNDVDRLLDSATACYNVFSNNHGLIWKNAESAQNQFAVLLLRKNAFLIERASNLVANQNPAQCRRNHGHRFLSKVFGD